MYKQNNESPIKNVSSIQYIFFVDDEKTVETSEKTDLIDNTYQTTLMNPFAKRIESEDVDYSLDFNEKGVLGYSKPFCRHCHSRKVIKYGSNKRDLILEDGTLLKAKVQIYECKKCGKFSQAELEGQYEPYCNFSIETKEKSKEIRELNWFPFRKMSKLYEIFNGPPMSHETIRKAQIITDDSFYHDSDIEPSGFYSYDVQWEPTDEGYYYRHLLFDLVHKIPVAEQLTKNEAIKTTENFLKKCTQPYQRKGIVTDLKPGYDSIMEKLGFKHQYCIFHLLLNINGRIKDYLKEIENQIKSKNKDLPKYKLKKIIKNELKSIKNEIKIYKELFFELFNQQTYKKAKNYINLLKYELKNFPPVLKNYLEKEFFPEYKKYILFLKKPFKGKLTRTNNPSEMYFRATMQKSEKKRYRTPKGVFNQILHRFNAWVENTKNQITN